MSIIHISKRENPYVQIDKRALEDNRLSWRAKGILAYLLSKPSGWKVNVKDIWNNGAEGRNAVQDCLVELQKIGYAKLITITGDQGKLMGSQWVITEEPEGGFSELAEKPKTGKPINRESGSRAHSNNEDSLKENQSNIEVERDDTTTKPNEINIEPNLNEDPKKQNNFTGRCAAKKEKTYTPHIHPENEKHFEYFSDPGKAKAAWMEWIEYKHTQHREKYKEPKTELAKLRQLFQQFNGDSKKFEDAVNYSIGNLYKGIFAPKIENGNGKFQHLDKAQQQHVRMARFVADIHNGTAFANTGTVDIITGE
jgi:hypothetical protein